MENIIRPSKDYLGARFYKCDLQMQTPFDSNHWVGESFDITNQSELAAEAYIRRCYEVGLEVIALTEHNFISKDKISLFQKQAKALSKDFGYELVIFPGFEFTANVGKGLHVLAVFEPESDLNEIDHILTKCGVDHPRQDKSGQHVPSEKSLKEIISVVQAPSASSGWMGLVILPHIQSTSGIFDGDKIAEWLQAKEFTNPDLLAVEVPKSPEKMSKAFQKLFESGDACEAKWKRARPVCCIMSSDAKTLAPNEKTGNYIGSRYTWIKMSRPSIEALRQAFIDHDSRIRRSDENPERPDATYTHPFIEHIEIRDTKFLADVKIHFSKNLNTIIGGRGTGKSTVIEYLRIALGHEGALIGDGLDTLQTDFANIQDTLKSGRSVINVLYNKGTIFEGETVELSVSDGAVTPIDAKYGDRSTYLPVKIYSRGQIEAIANDPQKQASIIDDLLVGPLDELENEEREVVRALRDLNETLQEEEGILDSQRKLVAEIANLRGQVNAIRSKHAALERWSKWNVERQYLASLEKASSDFVEEVKSAVLETTFNDAGPPDDGENLDLLEQENTATKKALENLKTGVVKLLAATEKELAQIRGLATRTAWQKTYTEIEQENKQALEDLRQQGILIEASDELFERLAKAQSQLESLSVRLQVIVSNREALQASHESDLLPIWEKQYLLRQGMAQKLNALVTKTKIKTPTVQTDVKKHGDLKSFQKMVAPYLQDKRNISQSDWDTIIRAAFDGAGPTGSLPIDIIASWIKQYKNRGVQNHFPSDEVSEKKIETLASWFPEYELNQLRMKRVADSVVVSLHRRDDGKLVGDLTSRKLSAGQKATTVLSLLLAEGTCPIIIDQPEDDLDNEFVYEQLVPMLRASKENRQIIIVSHNANIPVNGDAELIVPLEVRDSRGTQKRINGELTVGALDKRPVQLAVELILEGSSEAFRRRREIWSVADTHFENFGNFYGQ